MRSWLLRWRVAGGFTLPLPQIRSGATLRRSAISDLPDNCRQRQILKCCKELAHPPFQEDWGMCLRRQWPTHPSQAIPFWGVGFYPQPLFKGGLWWRRRLGGWGTALSRRRRCHSSGKGTKLRYARPHQAALGHARKRWAEGAPGFPRLCHSFGERRCNDAAALSLTTRLGFRAGVRTALPLKRRCGTKLRYARPC